MDGREGKAVLKPSMAASQSRGAHPNTRYAGRWAVGLRQALCVAISFDYIGVVGQ